MEESTREQQKDFWWEAPKEELHKSVFATIRHLSDKQSHRTEENLRNFRLYGNSQVLGLKVGEFQSIKSLSKLTMNVIQSAVDTATAKISKAKPKVTFLTEGGQFELASQAKNLEKYVAGTFYDMDLYEKGQKIFRDGAVFGDGFVHFYKKKHTSKEEWTLKAERVFPEEIVVDEDEAIYGDPRSMHRVKYVTKQVIAGMFPGYKKQIMNSGTDDEGSYLYDDFSPSVIKLVESWHLPSGAKGDQGRHTISVQHATLLDENWEKDYFPFEKWSWNERLLGYWSQGISEQITGIQIEINKILKTIQQVMHIGVVPKIFVEAGSQIVDTHFNNQVGTLIKYNGTLPQSGTLLSVPPELFLQLDRLYQRAFEIIGIAELAATGKKPDGLDSGKALREFADLQTERFAVVNQRWENFYMRCGKKIIRMSKDAAKEKKSLSVKTIDKRGMKVIKWNDVDLDEEKYVMKAWPTNLLSDTPSGKLADVLDLQKAQLINRRQSISLLDFPDISGVLDFETAMEEDLRATIEEMVSDGIYSPPERFQDLEAFIPVMQGSYAMYKRRGLDDDRLELFVKWIDDALNILNPPQETEGEMMDDEELANQEFEEELAMDAEMNGQEDITQI